MHISKVITYKGAWELLNNKYSVELVEILDAVSEYTERDILRRKSSRNEFVNMREIWSDALHKKGWTDEHSSFRTESGRRLILRSIGPIKGGVSAAINQVGISDFVSRWLFQQSTLAIKNKIVELPILLLPISEFARNIEPERNIVRLNNFEYFKDQLEMLSPLSHSYPFVVLGYTDKKGRLEVIELESDPLVEETKIIDRSIEFPPEYHQAGLNILNYFGTYLREQYPAEDAKVKIEQDGLLVRLIIESKDGKSEIIEKALHEYQMIVSGVKSPEEIISNEKLVMEFKNELRFAKLRVEFQQDMINLQNTRIDQLLKLVEAGLSNKTPVIIDFKPTISSVNNVHINQNISNALNELNDLKNLFPYSSEVHPILTDLEGSMEAVERESNPDVVKNSPAMIKFKKLLDKASDKTTDVGKVFQTVENSWEIFKSLAGSYNKIAQWCGLPQVPTIFTK